MAVIIKSKKILCDYEYNKNNIFAGGMITLDENKSLKIFQGVIYGEEMKMIGIFEWNINDKLNILKTNNPEFIKEIISDILIELKKEGL